MDWFSLYVEQDAEPLDDWAARACAEGTCQVLPRLTTARLAWMLLPTTTQHLLKVWLTLSAVPCVRLPAGGQGCCPAAAGAVCCRDGQQPAPQQAQADGANGLSGGEGAAEALQDLCGSLLGLDVWMSQMLARITMPLCCQVAQALTCHSIGLAEPCLPPYNVVALLWLWVVVACLRSSSEQMQH